jgi:hypothetical protein
MKKNILVILLFVTGLAINISAQDAVKPQTTRPKVVASPTPTPTPKTDTVDNSQVKDLKGATQVAYTPKDAAAKDVLAAFDKLINGIRNVNVEAVTAAYWNSPQLTLFNYNGTVTRGWEQMKKNREASFAETKEVVLDARDIRVQMTGRDGAVVSFLWKQSQTFRANPETSTGRTALVFRLIGKEWKVIHSHVSPDNPDRSRVPASEEPKNP